MNTTWLKIAEDTIAEAEKVDCSLREFAFGLQVVLEELKIRLDCVEDELRSLDDEEDE